MTLTPRLDKVQASKEGNLYIPNASAPFDTAGWTVYGSNLILARTILENELPRKTTETAFKLTANAGTQTTADYVGFDFSLDDPDLGSKLKQALTVLPIGAYVSGDFEIFIAAQTDRTSPIFGSIPMYIVSYNTTIQNSFDTSSVKDLSLIIRATGDMATGAGITFSDVIVGRGNIAKIPATHGPRNFDWTIQASSGGVSLGTQTFKLGWYTKNENGTADIYYEWQQTTAGSAGTGVYSLSMPPGLTQDLSKITSGSHGRGTLAGSSRLSISTGNYGSGTPCSTSLGVGLQIGNDLWGSTSTWNFGVANIRFSVHVVGVPIAEWSDLENYSSQPDIEYASVSGTWNSNTSTTVYGMNGLPMEGALTASVEKTITWQTPVRPSDRIEIWASRDRVQWFPMHGAQIGPTSLTVIPSSDNPVDYVDQLVGQTASAIADNTITNIGSGSLTLPPGTYIVDFGAMTSVNFSVAATGYVRTQVLVTDSSNNNLLTSSSGTKTEFSTTSYRNTVKTTQELTLASSTTIKLRGEIQAIGGTISDRNFLHGHIIVRSKNTATNNASGVAWRSGATPSQTVITFNRYMAAGANGASPSEWPSSDAFWVVTKAAQGANTGFNLVSASSAGLYPANLSNLDNVAATRMGLKFYSHGTTYNGGNAPTVTLDSGGGTLSSLENSFFIPYQMQDGSWRLKGSFTTVVSSTSRTSAYFRVNGISINGNQPIAATSNAGSSLTRARAVATNLFQVDHVSQTTVGYYVGFDIALLDKPTWAY